MKGSRKSALKSDHETTNSGEVALLGTMKIEECSYCKMVRSKTFSVRIVQVEESLLLGKLVNPNVSLRRFLSRALGWAPRPLPLFLH